MKRAGNLQTIIVGLVLSVSGAVTSCAQGNYGQPTYPPDYGQQQPGYGQPPYNQGYDPYGQPYGQQYGQQYGQPDFYGQLSPYGQWVNTPEYGRVWIPNAGPNFQPYVSGGHWAWTEYGNTWVSDYPWGWGPFHYGRWFRDPYRGWAWVPGYEWGPAWVSWRQGGGYYGWAPLGPGVNISVNINIPAPYWTFVPQVYITSPRLYSYCVPRPQVINIYQSTTIINNAYRYNNRVYGYGPRREEIEYVTRQRVPVYRVENTGRPGRDQIRDGAIGIYRPDGGRSTVSGPTAGPSGRGSSRVYNEPFDNQGSPGNPNDGYSRGRAGNAGTYGGGAADGGRSYGGSYGGNSRSNPADATPSYPSSGYGSSRGSGGRPGYGGQAPQGGQTYPQSLPPSSPPSSPSQGPREWGGRQGGSYSQSGGGSAAGSPSREQQGGGFGGGRAQEAPREQRGGGGEGGGYRSGRGSSRGAQ